MITLARLDAATLARGILMSLVVVVPAAAVSATVADSASDDGTAAGPLGILLVALILVGFGLGGRRAARTGVDLPITHGAFVGLLTFTVVQAGLLVITSFGGREGDLSASAIAISALMATAAGMIGASLGLRRAPTAT